MYNAKCRIALDAGIISQSYELSSSKSLASSVYFALDDGRALRLKLNKNLMKMTLETGF